MATRTTTITAVLSIFALTACSGLEKGSPLSKPMKADKGEDVATVSVTALNVLRWGDIANDLQATQFDSKPADMLAAALTTTSYSSSAFADALSASVSAVLSGAAVTKTEQTTVKDGQTTTAYDSLRRLTTPAAPAPLTFIVEAPPPQSGAAGAPGVEAHLRYRVAKSLAEEIAVLNRQIGGLVTLHGLRPYFVNLQLVVHPKEHGYPYDSFVTLDFATTYAGAAAPAEAAAGADKTKTTAAGADKKKTTASVAGLTSSGDHKAVVAAETKSAKTENEKTSSAVEKAEIITPRLKVIPLFITDSMEAVQTFESSDIVRQLGAQIQASGGTSALTAGTQQLLRKLDQDLALRPNSLLSVARTDEDSLEVRIGANQFGRSYEMIPRSYGISFVLLADKSISDKEVSSQIWAEATKIAVKGKIAYKTAMLRSVSVKRRPEWSVLETKEVPFDSFELPLYRGLECPAPQTTPLIVASDGSASLQLAGGEGWDYRKLEANLQWPIDWAGTAKAAFVTRDLRPTRGGNLQVTFPTFIVAKAAGDRRKPNNGTLTFYGYLRDEGGDMKKTATTCPAGGEYKIVYAEPQPAANGGGKEPAAAAGGSLVSVVVNPAAAAVPAASPARIAGANGATNKTDQGAAKPDSQPPVAQVTPVEPRSSSMSNFSAPLAFELPPPDRPPPVVPNF